MSNKHCGYIAIIGRPNVGKSTLLNHILGQKISITSRKPQTTRHQILGIHTTENAQLVFVDTPGLHNAKGKVLNRVMNKNALSMLNSVDVILFMIEAMVWTDADEWVLNKLSNVEASVILVVNKADKVKEKYDLLPFIEKVSEKYQFAEIVPVSAKNSIHLPELEQQVVKLLPVQNYFFDESNITDRSMRFIAAEIIREKIIRSTGQELPYVTAVEIEQYKQKGKITHISASILVEKPSQKAMLIGKNGEKMKAIGRTARLDIEKNLGNKVFLQLWVKVRGGWADDERALHSLGYTD
jgi:GTP-binding protein Era